MNNMFYGNAGGASSWGGGGGAATNNPAGGAYNQQQYQNYLAQQQQFYLTPQQQQQQQFGGYGAATYQQQQQQWQAALLAQQQQGLTSPAGLFNNQQHQMPPPAGGGGVPGGATPMVGGGPQQQQQATPKQPLPTGGVGAVTATVADTSQPKTVNSTQQVETKETQRPNKSDPPPPPTTAEQKQQKDEGSSSSSSSTSGGGTKQEERKGSASVHCLVEDFAGLPLRVVHILSKTMQDTLQPHLPKIFAEFARASSCGDGTLVLHKCDHPSFLRCIFTELEQLGVNIIEKMDELANACVDFIAPFLAEATAISVRNQLEDALEEVTDSLGGKECTKVSECTNKVLAPEVIAKIDKKSWPLLAGHGKQEVNEKIFQERFVIYIGAVGKLASAIALGSGDKQTLKRGLGKKMGKLGGK
eukprot:TRINITY_DN65857_c0_g1_i1.p1 TRINITY_DN65857_c0_g1~~TRINITY_DN65857_c0_g1_i1.p1  ORF type:complete len:415 (-),score=102.19 TRINITY_DN65857_c0_g1_i1:260-1504(-)